MWNVYTPYGDYTGIQARTAQGAKWVVWRMTLGRVELSRMTAVRVSEDWR